MEGQPGSSNWVFNHPSDDTLGVEFCPNAPFWRTYLGQDIFKYGTIRTSYVNPIREAPLNEEMFRRVQPSIGCLSNLQENLANIITSPLPHHAPMSSLLPHIS